MNLFIGYSSALEYWRNRPAYDDIASQPVCRVTSLRGCAISIKEVKMAAPEWHGFPYGEDMPLDILVPQGNKRRRSLQLKPHVQTDALPIGSFYHVAHGVYVSSPELVYLQMSKSLELEELVLLGYELCGLYSRCSATDSDTASFTQRMLVLSSKTRIFNYLRRCGLNSKSKAMRALQWVVERCASPAESVVAAMLCLPQNRGGYGYMLPLANQKLFVGQRLSSYVKGNYYYPDLLWERVRKGSKIKVGVEYDSHQEHDEPTRAEATRIRRNDLKTLGILVTSINRSQLRNAEAFDLAARQIGRDLGLRRPEAGISDMAHKDFLLRKLMLCDQKGQ
ncbi:MAG: hypothetical protein IJ125_07215 [Atopobiaceae bacterium]|nr:hypothetical protein [Atopobiaceae bacterium]